MLKVIKFSNLYKHDCTYTKIQWQNIALHRKTNGFDRVVKGGGAGGIKIWVNLELFNEWKKTYKHRSYRKWKLNLD